MMLIIIALYRFLVNIVMINVHALPVAVGISYAILMVLIWRTYVRKQSWRSYYKCKIK